MPDIRLYELWPAIKARVNSGGVVTALGGAGHVYVSSDNYEAPEGLENAQWGRAVIEPTRALWPQVDESDRWRRVGFQLVVEFNNFLRAGYNVERAIDATHAEAWTLLQNWLPVPSGGGSFTYLKVMQPVYRAVPPQSFPEWDAGRGLWWKSAEFRLMVVPA